MNNKIIDLDKKRLEKQEEDIVCSVLTEEEDISDLMNGNDNEKAKQYVYIVKQWDQDHQGEPVECFDTEAKANNNKDKLNKEYGNENHHYEVEKMEVM